MKFDFEIVRPLEIHDTKASHYLNLIIGFLGEVNIQSRIKRIRQIYDYEKGTIYRKYYLDKKYSFWNSLIASYEFKKSGKSFKGALKSQFIKSIMTACYIGSLYKTFTQSKLKQLKSIILKLENMQSCIFELQVAASLWKFGFDIQWFEDSQDKRIPEFKATYKDITIEIECKSKNINTGRQILREDFYRLSDNFFKEIYLFDEYSGLVSLTFNKKLPSNQSYQCEIIGKLIKLCKRSSFGEIINIIEKDYCIQIEKVVNNDNSEEFDQKIIEIQKNNPTLPYLVASTWKNKDSEKMWVIFKLESKTEDQVIKKIIEEINDGIKQFTGNSSSIICCHIPEIDSFSGLENSSAVKNATN